jgi:hypothetical protein
LLFLLFERGRKEKRGFTPLKRPASRGEESERGHPPPLFLSPLQPIISPECSALFLAGEGIVY